MEPATFEFDPQRLPELDQGQRAFLQLVAEAIRRLSPIDLDMDRIAVGIEKHSLWVTLPNRHDEECLVIATVSSDEVVVSYGYEHEHFLPNDPEDGRVWPIDAPDFVAAAARFVEQSLLGRIDSRSGGVS